MGLLKGLFGGKDRQKGKPARGGAGWEADADPLAELVGELEREGTGGPAVADVTVDSSPKQVCRYVFQRLAAGTPSAPLRADLVGRGLSGKVADAYIQLIRTTMFKGR